MKKSKLSLDAFKAKANTTNQTELLENVQGGAWDDCHGISGSMGKAADAFVQGLIDGLTSN